MKARTTFVYLSGLLSGFIVMTILSWLLMGLHAGVWVPRDYVHYLRCTFGISDIGADIWHGRITAGKPLTPLLAHIHVAEQVRHGPWVEVQMVPGGTRGGPGHILLGDQLILIARDDQLVYGAYVGCTHERVFFDTLGDRGRKEMLSSRKQHNEPRPITPPNAVPPGTRDEPATSP